MTSAPRSRRFGRWAAVLAALGAAAVAALAVPGGVRLYQENCAIRRLDSANRAEVREGIATLVRLRSERGAKRLFELAVKVIDGPQDSSPETVQSWSEMFRGLHDLPMSDRWLLETARSGSAEERRLALRYIGQKGIQAALPLLRAIAVENSPLSQNAILVIAQLLPTVQVLGTRTTESGVEARFRLQNATGYDLWYRGAPSKPLSYKTGGGKTGIGKKQSISIDRKSDAHRLGQAEQVEFLEEFDSDELPGILHVLLWASEALGDCGVVESQPVERPAPGGPGP